MTTKNLTDAAVKASVSDKGTIKRLVIPTRLWAALAARIVDKTVMVQARGGPVVLHPGQALVTVTELAREAGCCPAYAWKLLRRWADSGLLRLVRPMRRSYPTIVEMAKGNG